MFKQLQNSLLLNHPLLWNIKIVPMLAITIGLNLLFFIIGFLMGSIDFTGNENWSSDTNVMVNFFAVTAAVLITIMWLVYYFRNNAFKSYYTKGRQSLFTEWLLILAICLLNCLYTASYSFAKDLRARSYFSEQEFSHRADIIGMASIFVQGGYNDDGQYTDTTAETAVVQHRDYMEYKGKRYPLNSLFNKALSGFSYNKSEKDSLNELRVKSWLLSNRKDSVLWLMKEFDKIAKSHNLHGNITPQQWFNLVYDYPDFTSSTIVGRNKEIERWDNNQYERYDAVTTVEPLYDSAHDTISNIIKVIDGATRVYPKYYVPFEIIKESYSTISSAWVAPDIDGEALTVYFYFAIMLSLLIFAFRVTSGRSWLIAAISLGILSMLSGVFSLITSSGGAYLFFWLIVTILLMAIYFGYALYNKEKEHSAVVLNTILWLMPWVLPMIYMSILSLYDHERYGINHVRTPFERWLDENASGMMYFNIALILVYMYFVTLSIKKWKGLAEA